MPKTNESKPRIPDFSRDIFTMIVERHSVNIDKIKEMVDRKLIGEHDMLFTLDAVKAICAVVYSGGWVGCSKQPRPAGKWSMETKARNARKFIKDAY